MLVALLFAFVLGCALIVSCCTPTSATWRRSSTAALLPWFFLTPIFYQPDTLRIRAAASLALETLLDWVNPVAPFIDAFRSILYYGTAPDLGAAASTWWRRRRCAVGRR